MGITAIRQATLVTIEGEPFTNRVVNLDGVDFVRCRFENCTLVYSGRCAFGLEACTFVNTRAHLAQPAADTLACLVLLHHHGLHDLQTALDAVEVARAGAAPS